MSGKRKSKLLLRHHPIQLESIDVAELFIRVNNITDVDEALGKKDVLISHAHGDYDEETQTVQVGLRIEIGMGDEPKTPFSMKIELSGEFRVDESRFDKDFVGDWANKNSQFILYPYLREHAYALTVRCGLPPAILPLIEVPTFEIPAPSEGGAKAGDSAIDE